MRPALVQRGARTLAPGIVARPQRPVMSSSVSFLFGFTKSSSVTSNSTISPRYMQAV